MSDISKRADSFFIKSIKQKIIGKIPHLSDIAIYHYGESGYAVWYKFNDSQRQSYISQLYYSAEQIIDDIFRNNSSLKTISMRPGYNNVPTLADIINKFEAVVAFNCTGDLLDFDDEKVLDYPIRVLIEGCDNDFSEAFFKMDDIDIISFIESLNKAKANAINMFL